AEAVPAAIFDDHLKPEGVAQAGNGGGWEHGHERAADGERFLLERRENGRLGNAGGTTVPVFVDDEGSDHVRELGGIERGIAADRHPPFEAWNALEQGV